MSQNPFVPFGHKHGAALNYEIAQDQASALGRLGRALEAALAALADRDRDVASTPGTSRAQRVAEAGDALLCFMV